MSSTDNNDRSQDVPDTAEVAKPMDAAVNSTMVKSKMANGTLNGSVSGIKYNMGTEVVPSHVSVENLITNRKEYLKASADNSGTHDGTFSSEESDFINGSRSLAECTKLLEEPVRPL